MGWVATADATTIKTWGCFATTTISVVAKFLSTPRLTPFWKFEAKKVLDESGFGTSTFSEIFHSFSYKASDAARARFRFGAQASERLRALWLSIYCANAKEVRGIELVVIFGRDPTRGSRGVGHAQFIQ
jgi:hypothetical protein